MDEVEITGLVYRCAEHIDNGELALAAALFENAQVKLHPEGETLNHKELLAQWQKEIALQANGTSASRQLISNPIIEIDKAGGRATCRSYYTVLQLKASLPLQATAAGKYHDKFVKKNGRWQFLARVCLPLEADNKVKALPPDLAEISANNNKESSATTATKQKILAAAQQTFSTVGYSEAGIRKIAELVELSPTILFRHFGTKAALFEAALIASMGEPKRPVNREGFGQHVADMLADPSQPNCPHAMTVLAIGNEESRAIAVRVLEEYTIKPMMEWLGPPNTESRAREIMALCAGFVLYNSQLSAMASRGIDSHMVDWLARSIQAIVDQ